MNRLPIALLLAFTLAACSNETDGGGGSGGEAGQPGGAGEPSGGQGGQGAGGGQGGEGGRGEGGAPGGGGSGGGECTPLTDDPSQIGEDCGGDMECDDGYTCFAEPGVALMFRCKILCEDTCECPEDTQCVFQEAKNTQWMECLSTQLD